MLHNTPSQPFYHPTFSTLLSTHLLNPPPITPPSQPYYHPTFSTHTLVIPPSFSIPLINPYTLLSTTFTSILIHINNHVPSHHIITSHHIDTYRWDLACVLDLANGQGTAFTPEEKKRAGDFDVANFRGSSGGGGGSSRPSTSTGSTKHPGSSSSTSLIGGLATVGGRLMAFDSPESAQQFYQDTNDARFITASLSGG